MVFNPFFGNKITRGDRVAELAEKLGFDEDDMASEGIEGMTQKVLGAREYLRVSQEQTSQNKPNTWAQEPKPMPAEDVQYRKTGLDEYRITYRGSRGANFDDVNRYPPLNSVKSATELFADVPFALQQLPAMYEDESGNIWSMETKGG